MNTGDAVETIRRQVWLQLQAIARPDSRFHWDFASFIPDFEGSEMCCEQVCQTALYQDSVVLFVTPDNSLMDFRGRCLLDGKTLIIPTYGITRGFFLLERSKVPQGQEAFAATLDGLESFGRPCNLSALPGPELLVSGASVINREGVRVSPGPSYFDLEWLILSAAGLVEEGTPIMTVIHDCQLVDLAFKPSSFAVAADWIITPTLTYRTGQAYTRPTPAVIRDLPWEIIQDVPLLQQLMK